jgi:hypothetical protein
MTELETMQRAKMYMDKLAQGIDPISNQEVPGDSALNNVRLAQCFFYVSDILGQVIANGGVVGQITKTLDFVITPEQLASVQISEYPIRVTEFTEALYRAVNNPEMKKLSTTKITEWLILKGLMMKEASTDGKTYRVPTDRGLQMGMSTRLRQSRDGEYRAVYYDKNMQRFLLDNLAEILMGNKQRES